jgi:flagellar protein FlaG
MTAVSSSVLVSSLSHAVLPAASRAVGAGEKLSQAQKADALSNATEKPQVQASDSSKQTAKTLASSLSKEDLAKQVHELQAKMDKLNPALAFVVDQDSGRALIQLTDRATKEVILQYPSQAALEISKALDRFAKGQLVNRTV